jgi:pyruvate dehydrogenase E2 component (dihydrolipoamide acetyltransferase)
MPTDVIMPQMGESIFEGTITKWFKQAGDHVEKDEPLFEISTDKVDAEIPSPVAGILSEIKIPEGETVQVNTVVAVIGGAEASGAAKPQLAPSQGSPQAQAPEPQAGGTEIVMPQMGESIFEGTITKWLKKAGDHVEKDEPLFEISTDKVDAEIPSPIAGILTEIKIPEGATVQVNTVVAILGGASGALRTPPRHQRAASTAIIASRTESATSGNCPHRADAGRQRSSPLVRRIAKEHNIDLQQVSGTGSEGRITKDDILRHLSQHGPGTEAPPSQLAPPQMPERRSDPASLACAPSLPSAWSRACSTSPHVAHRLQGRHDPHRPPPRAREGRLRAAQRRQAHLHALHRRCCRRGAAPLSHRQRLAHRRTSIQYHPTSISASPSLLNGASSSP